MKFLFFAGCKIENYLKHYETASRAVLGALGVELVDVELNCCGYPVRHQNIPASILSAARNLALASKHHLDILTPCKCCFGNLKYAISRLREDAELRKKINALLEREGLFWEEGIQVKHLLSVLYHDVGLEAIQAKVKNPFQEVKIAPHYGCHALRPSRVVQFDNPLAPTLFEKLVEVTGAESVSWERRLECCGNPLWERNNSLSLYMMRKKLENAQDAGADFICVACTYCQIQFDQVRAGQTEEYHNRLPSILYPQLLGLSMGLEENLLGIEKNAIDSQHLTRYCQSYHQGLDGQRSKGGKND
ncbi:MAG: disulfide reductase [Deltaproteobacteria bacterium]|nr:MAG: disulfide reductase [Deltaproteobacteria bacterium]